MKKSKTNISIVDNVGGRVKPSIILGGGARFQSGDLLDANAVAKIVADEAAQIDLSGLLTKEDAQNTYATKEALLSLLANIEQQIATEVAKIIAGADESFDTFKEVADWIGTHSLEAARTAGQVDTNTEDISDLKDTVDVLDESMAWINA